MSNPRSPETDNVSYTSACMGCQQEVGKKQTTRASAPPPGPTGQRQMADTFCPQCLQKAQEKLPKPPSSNQP